MNMIKWLEKFNEYGCQGNLGCFSGIKIDTLDNPGWCFNLDLSNTIFENRPFLEHKIDRNDNDWVHCYVRNNYFEGFGGPNNLNELLVFFRDWAGLDF